MQGSGGDSIAKGRRMGEPNGTYVLDDAALAEGGLAPVYPLGVSVVLARVEGIAYAVSGRCAHMACPLFTGRLEGHTLICGCHEWRFDVRTGMFANAPELGIKVFPVQSVAGKLFIDIEGSVP
jgi:nitrite reductase/ring-hydroxylating ferredoxin subunit